MVKLSWYLIITFFFVIVSCKNNEKKYDKAASKKMHFKIQPMNGFSQMEAQEIAAYLNAFYPNISLNKSINFPTYCYEKARDRYWADSTLKFFKTLSKKDTVIVGLTNSDISITNDDKKSWGVMGLAHRPGTECINSTFRLNKSKRMQQFKKNSVARNWSYTGLATLC